jgi:hypothetical protein
MANMFNPRQPSFRPERRIPLFHSRFLAGAILTLLVAFAVASNTARAADILVPEEIGTIQGAIVSAVDGDRVLVEPGTYFENINFLGKAITISSTEGPEITFIDGGGVDSVVTFNTDEGPESVIKGFTIRNGVF